MCLASHCVSIADRHRRVAEVEQPSKPFRFSLQINAGCVAEAEQLLDQVLEGSPKDLGALVARGTARALRKELAGKG